MNKLNKNFGCKAFVTYAEIINNPIYWKEQLYDKKILVLKGLNSLHIEELYDLHLIFGTPWTLKDYEDTYERSFLQIL